MTESKPPEPQKQSEPPKPSNTEAKAALAASVKGFPDDYKVFIVASALRAVGGVMPNGTPDGRPLEITAGAVRALCK